MFERVRRVLIDSYIGAIALGWIFAQAILHFAYMFAAPVASWVSRRQYRGMLGSPAWPTGFFVQEALPELIKTVLLFGVGYVLLHWLYLRNSTQTPTRTSQTSSMMDAPPLSEG